MSEKAIRRRRDVSYAIPMVDLAGCGLLPTCSENEDDRCHTRCGSGIVGVTGPIFSHLVDFLTQNVFPFLELMKQSPRDLSRS